LRRSSVTPRFNNTVLPLFLEKIAAVV